MSLMALILSFTPEDSAIHFNVRMFLTTEHLTTERTEHTEKERTRS